MAHGHGPYGFEDPAFRWLGSPSTTSAWARLAEILAVPAIAVVFVVCIALGAVDEPFFVSSSTRRLPPLPCS